MGSVKRMRPAEGAGVGLGPLVRKADPDRYFCALFAPDVRREALFTLYAFNHELARANEVTREPGLSLIRLQWWREVVEGKTKAHEVAGPLSALLEEGVLPRGDLLAMIEAREREAEGGFAGIDEWVEWLRQGAGSAMVAAARTLGASGEILGSVRSLGAGVGVAGQLRNVRALAAQERCLLPEQVLAAAGLDAEVLIHDPGAAAVAGVLARLAERGAALLGPPQRRDRNWISACLQAVLARRDLRDLAHVDRERGLGARLAVTVANAVGRC